jgi:epoxyqueuosine reductase
MADISGKVKQKSKELGFLDCRIIPVHPLPAEKEHLEQWLSNSMHGEMEYMSGNIEKRIDPSILVPGAKSIIIVLQNYYPSMEQKDPEAPVISKYAYGEDYHFLMKRKLKALFGLIRLEMPECNGRIFVDSAPVLERAWAREAGLGWIGRNSNLISQEHGSFFFIGEIILENVLPYDEVHEVKDHCGKCSRCIEACPTGAIVASGVVDARKCISYQTIELKGELDPGLKGKFRNRVFGCDICQDVCPWNLKALPHSEPAFYPEPDLLEKSDVNWHSIERDEFDRLFARSAVKRTGLEGLKRNLAFLES